MEMQLTADESELVEALRRLPQPAAGEIVALVRRLADLSKMSRVDWSDSWSEEDMREFTAASVDSWDASEGD